MDEAVRAARARYEAEANSYVGSSFSGSIMDDRMSSKRARLAALGDELEAAIRASERAKVEALLEAAERLEAIWNEPLDDRVLADETDPQVIFAGRWQQYARLDEATKDVIAALDAVRAGRAS